MSRYEDLKKKWSNETGSGSRTPASRYETIKANMGSSTYGVDESYIHSFLRDSQKLLDSSNEESKNMDWKKATDKAVSQSRKDTLSDLRTRSANIRAYLNANRERLDGNTYKDLISTLDSLQFSNSQISQYFRETERYYSQWDSEDSYIKGAKETGEQRQKRYEENLAKIKALNDELSTISYDWTDANQRNASVKRSKEIHSDIKALETENKNYERGLDGWISKEEDASFKANQEYGKKYAGKSYEEINGILSKLEDGAEKDWLTEYAPMTMTSGDYDREIEKVSSEITTIENMLSDYNSAMAQWGSGGYDEEEAIKENGRRILNAYGYTGNREAEAKLEELKAYRWKLENEKRYQSLQNQPDFSEKSRATETDATAGFGIGVGKSWLGIGDPVYDYINDLNGAREKERDSYDEKSPPMYAVYDYMNGDEIQKYNYLYHTSGKSAAMDYLSYLEYTLNQRKIGKVQRESSYFAEDNQVLASVVSVPVNLMSGVGFLDIAGQNIGKSLKERVTGEYAGPVDYNSGAMVPTAVSSTIRGTVAQNIADSTGTIQLDEDKHPFLSRIFNGKSLGDVYQLGMSMVDSAAIAGLTFAGIPGGTYLLGGSAASQGVLDAVAKGATDEQALFMGLLNGAAEVFFEKYEIESILKNASDGFLKSTLKSMLSEGVGEGATTIANTLSDIFVMAEKSDWQKSIDKYVQDNLSPEDAKKQAFWDALIQVGWDFIGGAAMGGIMGGLAAPIDGTVSKYANAKEIYGADPGALISESLEIDPENRFAQKMRDRINSGKDLSGRQLYKLVQGNESAIRSQDMDSVREVAEKSSETDGASGNTGSLEDAAKKYGAQAQAMIHTYQAGQDVAKYDAAYQLCYDMGKSGVSFDYAKKSLSVGYLTDIQKELAYNAGRDAADSTNGKSSDGKAFLTETGEEIDIQRVASIRDGEMLLDIGDGKTVNAKDVSYASEEEAILYETVGTMDLDANSANRLLNGLEKSGLSAYLYANAIEEAYNYGNAGVDYADMVSNGVLSAKLDDPIRRYAYNLGRMALESDKSSGYNKTTNMEGDNHGTGEEVYLRGGVQRTDSEGAGRPIRGVGEGTGTVQNGQKETAGRSGDSGKDHGNAQGQVSTKELGVPDGTDVRNLSYADDTTAQMKEAKALAKQHGLDLVAFTGGNLTIHSADGAFEARAYISGNKVCVRADHPNFSLMQLLKHEIGHNKIRKGNVDMKKVYDAIADFASEEYVETVIASYVEAYASLEGYDADYILEEILCDYEAGMNIFSKDTVPDSFWEMSKDILKSDAVKQDTVRGSPMDAGKASAESEKNLPSEMKGENGLKDFDKPITIKDIETLRSIGRKSINSFTSEDIQKAQKWAYKFYNELGTKSPFFRAWFGDWRTHQTSEKVQIASIPAYIATNEARKTQRGNTVNTDTGWDIRISREGETNTISHAGAERMSEYGLSGMRQLVENAVLLDTEVHEHHSNNAKNDTVAFNHKLYALGESVNGSIGLYKITVEERYQDPYNTNERRFHNLKYIEKVAEVSADANVQQRHKDGSTMRSSTTNYSVSDLYEFVKRLDKDFTAAHEVSPLLLNEDGTPKVFYHGTNAKFTVFSYDELRDREGSFFFSESREDAESYGNEKHGGRVFAVYLSGKNLADYDNQPSEFYSLKNKREQVRWLKARGYDGWYSDMDSGGYGEVSVFTPSQIKSATDNIGTFDGSNPDIRFSREFIQEQKKLQDEVTSVLEKENAKLKEDISSLKEMLKLQRTVTGGTKFTKSSVKAAAVMLKNKANVKKNADTDALASLLNDFYAYIAKSKELTWEDVMEAAQPAVDWLRDNERKSFERDEYAQEVLDAIRGRSIYLDEEQKSEAAHAYGSYQAFRKKLMGTFTISDHANTSLDQFWKEMSSQHPYYFPEDVTSGYQVTAIMDAVSNIRNAENVDEESFWYSDEMANRSLLYDVYDSYWSVSTLYTQADRNQMKINRLKMEHRNKLDDVKAENRRQMQELNSYYRDRIAQIRKSYNERLEKKQRELTDKYREQKKKALDSRRATELRNKVKKYVEDFRQRLMNPTDRRYIPANLVGGIIDIYDAIDPTGVDQDSKAAQKYRSAKEALAQLKLHYDSLEKEDYEFSYEFSKEFSQSIADLAEAVGDKPLRDMSRSQLEDVYTIIHDISAMVRDATKQIGTSEAISNYEAGQEIISNMAAVKSLGIGSGKLSSFFREWTENPMRAVREMTAYDPEARLLKLFNAINEGRRKADKFSMDCNKKFDALRSGKEGEAAFNSAVENASISVTDISGNTVHISKMQAMQAILTFEREQANKNRNHLSSPVRFTNVEFDVKGKYTRAFDSGYDVMVDDAFIVDAMSALSEWDKAYMDLARQFFNVDAKNAVNETSMITKHRPIATENAYIPYYVNQDYISKESDNVKFDASIEGMGMLKSVKNNARQQLVIRGLNAVISDHIGKVAKVYGLAVPIRNWNKAFNMKQTFDDGGKSVKASIREVWNDGGLRLLDQAVADVQSNRRAQSVKALSSVKSAFVTSTLAGNISVFIKQAASYPTAGSLLRTSSLIKALPKFGRNLRKLWDEIDAHTSQHYIRRLGLSTQELGEMNQSHGWQNKLNKKMGAASPMNWIQAMDVKTTAVLWIACKYDVGARGITKDSEGYWDQVTELYDKVIEDTQPMYDALHRAEITKNTALRNIIMFQTQPIQNSGILREGAMEYKMAKKKHGANSSAAKKAAAKYRKAVGSQVASHLVFTAMTLIANALLHKMNPYRDDDKELKADSVFIEFMKQFGENFFGAIVPVFGNYGIAIAEKIIGSNRYDVLSDPTLDKINTTIDNFSKLKNPSIRAFITMACDVASYFGIPAQNIVNIIDGARMHIVDAMNGEFGSFDTGVTRTEEQKRKKLYDAIMSGDSGAVSRAKAMYEDKDDLGSAMRTALREHDPRIREAAIAWNQNDLDGYMRIAKEIIAEKHFVQDDVVMAIRSEASSLDQGEKPETSSKAKGLFTAEKFGEAVAQGDTATANAIKSDIIQTEQKNGKTEDEAEEQFISSAKSSLKEYFLDGKISDQKAENALEDYCELDGDGVHWTMDKWKYEKKNSSTEGYSKYLSFHTAVQTGKNLKTVIKEYTDYGVDEKDLASEITRHFKPLYREMSKYDRAGIKGYLLNAYAVLGYDRAKKSKDIDRWLED